MWTKCVQKVSKIVADPLTGRQDTQLNQDSQDSHEVPDPLTGSLDSQESQDHQNNQDSRHRHKSINREAR